MQPEAPPPSPTPAPPPSAKPRRARWGLGLWRLLQGLFKFALKTLLGGLSLCAAALIIALLGLGVWAGQEGSLASALNGLAKLGITAPVQGVTGSLAHGGSIPNLDLSAGGLSIQASDLQLRWQAESLLRGQLQIAQLSAKTLRITDHSAPSTSPAQPPTALRLPVSVQLEHLAIGQLQFFSAPPEHSKATKPAASSPSFEAQDLDAQYSYAAGWHQLKLQHIRIAQGSYQGQATLQAQRPLNLQAQLQGQLMVQATPGAAPLPIHTQLQVTGTLTAIQAHLQAQTAAASTNKTPTASATPTPKTSSHPEHFAPSNSAMHVDVQANIQPWSPLMLHQVQGQAQHFNLATFWPQWPNTDISGSMLPPANAPTKGKQTADSAYRIQLDLRNDAARPWDKQGLPIERAQGLIIWQGETLELRDVQIKSGAGQLTGHVQWQEARNLWQIESQFQHLDLSRLYSPLGSGSLSGSIQVHSRARAAAPVDSAQAETALAFDLQAASDGFALPHAAPAKFNLRRAKIQGSWSAHTLELPELAIETADAQLQGQAQYNTQTDSAQVELKLQAPGLQASAQGKLAAKTGQGQVQLDLRDAALASAWWSQIPAAPALALRGAAQFQGSWQGGWDNLRLASQLDAPALSILPPATKPQEKSSKNAENAAQAAPQNIANLSPALTLQQTQIRINGSLQSLQIQAASLWAADAWQGDAQIGGSAHITRADAHQPFALRLDLTQAKAHWQKDSQNAPQNTLITPSSPIHNNAQDAWALELPAPVQARWSLGQAELNAGRLRLSAPEALRMGGTRSVSVEWGASLIGSDAQGIRRVQTSGQILGIPQTWLETASGFSLSDLGLAGEMLLDARWNMRMGTGLAIQASLARQSGDLRLVRNNTKSSGKPTDTNNTKNNANNSESAGIRDWHISLSGSDQQLQVQTLWDSKNAGSVRADFSTRLSHSNGAWSWPETAPINGRIQAQLPQLGLWSALAPTGWRINGALSLDATVAGQRQAPSIQGQLQAQDLSMHSVIDGVDLQNGRLRTRFDGTRMTIEQFSIQGAEGQLQASGQMAWADGQPRMDVQLQAQRLRASNRPDRRITVSGQVNAHLENHRLQLTGHMLADQALILLADSSKPSLGEDVQVLRRPKNTAANTPANATTNTAQNAAQNAPPSEAEIAAQMQAAHASLQQSAQLLRTANQAATASPNATNTAPPLSLALDILWDMGPDFRVRGMGLDTRLTGTLNLHAQSDAPTNTSTSNSNPSTATATANNKTAENKTPLHPEITGALQTVDGEYRAYGQWLNIEEGYIRFTGPYNNPQLDVLAIRPRTEERVGVRITGPALNPRVSLYAENAMPDSEKLAWLILGREGGNGGAESAMLQQAAVALLGSGSTGEGLAQSLGLDEIGYRSAETNSDGTVRDSSISIGKRLSNRLYLSYERSLSGALGTLYVFYDVSRRFTLRAQTNAQSSAVDLIYTLRYQSLLPAKERALEAARLKALENEKPKENLHPSSAP